jgi:hypothetical protein
LLEPALEFREPNDHRGGHELAYVTAKSAGPEQPKIQIPVPDVMPDKIEVFVALVGD